MPKRSPTITGEARGAGRRVGAQPRRVAARSAAGGRGYEAPALDKGLDILETLAASAEGATLSQLAEALGRSTSELYRMLVRLHERGYLERDEGDRYALSAKLYELAHRHPPNRRLLQRALPAMRTLSDTVEQSCHLAQLHGDRLIVIAAVDSPAACGVSVRSGSSHALADTASGRLLSYWRSRQHGDESSGVALAARESKAIERDDVFKYRSRTHRGVIDLCCPVRDRHGVVAALTVPLLARRDDAQPIDNVAAAVFDAAASVTAGLGGPVHPLPFNPSPVV